MSETSSNRDFKGVWIPKEIWINHRLTRLQRDVLVEIHSLDNKFGCTANNQYFAEFFRTSPNSVSNIIQQLKNGGFLKVTFKDEKTKSGRILRVVKEAYFGTDTDIPDKIEEKETPTHEMEGGTQNVEGGTYFVEGGTQNVEHNNTFNNTLINTSLIEPEKKFEILNNPYWLQQKEINFPDLTDSEIEIGLGTYYLDYPNSKATQVFLFLKETNQKKILAGSKLEKVQSYGKNTQPTNFTSQNQTEQDLGRNYPIDDFKRRTAKKVARVYREDFNAPESFAGYLEALENLGVEIIGMDFDYQTNKKALPMAIPSFGKVPSLDVDHAMEQVRMARQREILKQQLQNA